jgi:hypothetical protein
MQWRKRILPLILVAGAVGAFGVATSGAAPKTVQKYLRLARVLHVRALRNAAPVPLPPGRLTNDLHAHGYGQLSFMGSAGGRNFYLLEHAGTAPCFATGRMTNPYPIGVWRCPQSTTALPTTNMPIVDLSIVGADNGGPMHIVSLAGVAANNVSQVEVINDAGAPVLTVPVVNNVFASSAVLGDDARRMEAIDANGKILAVWP